MAQHTCGDCQRLLRAVEFSRHMQRRAATQAKQGSAIKQSFRALRCRDCSLHVANAVAERRRKLTVDIAQRRAVLDRLWGDAVPPGQKTYIARRFSREIAAAPAAVDEFRWLWSASVVPMLENGKMWKERYSNPSHAMPKRALNWWVNYDLMTRLAEHFHEQYSTEECVPPGLQVGDLSAQLAPFKRRAQLAYMSELEAARLKRRHQLIRLSSRVRTRLCS
jgi:hypothetical protein